MTGADLAQPFPVRVAHLVRPAHGGMRQQVKSLLTHLPPVLLAAPPDVCEFCADVVPVDRLILPPVRRPDALLRNGLQAGKWAKQKQAQILHGHGLLWTPLFASAQSASRLPLVVTLHNLVPADLSVAQRLVLRLALRYAARILCVSGAVAQSAAPLVHKNKIVVVRNGIDGARFGNTPETVAQVRAAHGVFPDVSPDALVILCVARLSPEKGVRTLLEAAALLHKTGPPFHLWLAGDGPERDGLQSTAQASALSETVQFLGQCAPEEIADLMCAADLLVLPSLTEGLSLAVIEAMASGLPVVASHVGGVPEVVQHGETGLLVPPGDAPALADALQTLLLNANRRETMGRAGRIRAETHFSATRMIHETRAVYEAALSAPNKRTKGPPL